MADVASKKNGDRLRRTKVQVRLLPLAELKGVSSSVMGNLQDRRDRQLQPMIFLNGSLPVLRLGVGSQKDDGSPVFEGKNGGEEIRVEKPFAFASGNLPVGVGEAVLLCLIRSEDVNLDAGNLSGLQIRAKLVVGKLATAGIAVDSG